MKAYLTDEMVVERLRRLEGRLRERGLDELAAELAELASLLEPEDEAK